MAGGDDDDEVDYDEEGDADDEEEEVAAEKEGRMQQQQNQNEEGDYGEEDDAGEGDDNLEEDMEDHQAMLGMPKPTIKHTKTVASDDEDDRSVPSSALGGAQRGKGKDDEEDDEELDVELGKRNAVDAKRIQTIMDQFTKDQMSRYECYRRSNFPKANMRRVVQSIAGSTISMPMSIVMSGIAKMFVGELIETGRMVMTERNETGPLRPCHIREAYRRLKLKGKVPLRSRPRLFR